MKLRTKILGVGAGALCIGGAVKLRKETAVGCVTALVVMLCSLLSLYLYYRMTIGKLLRSLRRKKKKPHPLAALFGGKKQKKRRSILAFASR